MLPVRGLKWPGKHSPGFTRGLPWVIPATKLALKGALTKARIGSTGPRARLHFSSRIGP